jgi:chromosome segregation ATPase
MNDRDFQEFVINHLTELSNEVKQIRQAQVKTEIEHGEKLSALFDGYQSINETLADHTERLERIENKVETQNIQIEVLDKTKSNKRSKAK